MNQTIILLQLALVTFLILTLHTQDGETSMQVMQTQGATVISMSGPKRKKMRRMPKKGGKRKGKKKASSSSSSAPAEAPAEESEPAEESDTGGYSEEESEEA